MAVESPEDLAIFFDPRDFGVEDGDDQGALYAPRSGEAPYRVNGILDEPAGDFHPNQWPGGHLYQLKEGAPFVTSSPTFTCRAADLVKGGRSRDKLTIGDRVFSVTKTHPDGTGAVVLVLEANT